LQDQYNTLNKSRVALVGGYQLKAFSIDWLKNLITSVLEVVVYT
jgi:hypothetical protein